jgi:hypothetical protein
MHPSHQEIEYRNPKKALYALETVKRLREKEECSFFGLTLPARKVKNQN